MQKRVLLASILSIAVLFLWNTIVPSPQKTNTLDTQVIENKEVRLDAPTRDMPNASVRSSKINNQNRQPEETSVLDNGVIQAVFSTKNGTIKQIKLIDYDADLPVTGMFQLSEYEGLSYRIERQSETEIVFLSTVEGLEIRKSYELPAEQFNVVASMDVKNTSSAAISLNPDLTAMILDINLADEDAQKGRDRNLLEYSAYTGEKVVRKTGAFQFTQKDSKKQAGPVEWLGFRNRYFATIVKPLFDVSGYQTSPGDSEQVLTMSFLLEERVLSPGESAEFSAVIFAGPQKQDVLKAYEMNFEKIHVYFRFGFFDAISKILEDLMRLFYRVIPNWGVSIIIVSLLIYFIMYPLTMKSMVSMRRMQSLQPKIAELREKHEKNPQKLNQEIMKMYAENKVNPLGGCLPLLFQMPIFIALYQMIWRAVIFKGSDFLWINDLSKPDRLFVLPQSFPVIGNEINLLPIVILVLMVIQQRMTSKNMATADPNQMAQQKMMMFAMPAVLLFVFYRLGSGLTLYLTVFYLMSIFTQWKSSKIMKSA